MRLLLYNIRYATGTGPAFHLPLPGAGYLRSSRSELERITRSPDLSKNVFELASKALA